jgi:hypothetical protein
MDSPAERLAREAAALRENLRRRKAQARSRKDTGAQPGGAGPDQPADAAARPAEPQPGLTPNLTTRPPKP